MLLFGRFISVIIRSIIWWWCECAVNSNDFQCFLYPFVLEIVEFSADFSPVTSIAALSPIAVIKVDRWFHCCVHFWLKWHYYCARMPFSHRNDPIEVIENECSYSWNYFFKSNLTFFFHLFCDETETMNRMQFEHWVRSFSIAWFFSVPFLPIVFWNMFRWHSGKYAIFICRLYCLNIRKYTTFDKKNRLRIEEKKNKLKNKYFLTLIVNSTIL